jgi:hypothetical protein
MNTKRGFTCEKHFQVQFHPTLKAFGVIRHDADHVPILIAQLHLRSNLKNDCLKNKHKRILASTHEQRHAIAAIDVRRSKTSFPHCVGKRLRRHQSFHSCS